MYAEISVWIKLVAKNESQQELKRWTERSPRLWIQDFLLGCLTKSIVVIGIWGSHNNLEVANAANEPCLVWKERKRELELPTWWLESVSIGNLELFTSAIKFIVPFQNWPKCELACKDVRVCVSTCGCACVCEYMWMCACVHTLVCFKWVREKEIGKERM